MIEQNRFSYLAPVARIVPWISYSITMTRPLSALLTINLSADWIDVGMGDRTAADAADDFSDLADRERLRAGRRVLRTSVGVRVD